MYVTSVAVALQARLTEIVDDTAAVKRAFRGEQTDFPPSSTPEQLWARLLQLGENEILIRKQQLAQAGSTGAPPPQSLLPAASPLHTCRSTC